MCSGRGWGLVSVVPTPNWPLLLFPQLYTLLSSSKERGDHWAVLHKRVLIQMALMICTWTCSNGNTMRSMYHLIFFETLNCRAFTGNNTDHTYSMYVDCFASHFYDPTVLRATSFKVYMTWKFFLLTWKAFQNTEEWSFSFWNIFFRFRDIDIFLLCKLVQWWRHLVCN